jgi:CDP-4-dehydro-6-deoxyglucose reductase
MFGFSKNKSPRVATVIGDGTTIVVKPGENLLKAALDQGYPWPHNCRVGSCGTCRSRLVSGKIKPLNDFSYVLDKEELDAGYILACQSCLLSDVEIDVVPVTGGAALPQSRVVGGTMSRIQPLTHDIVALEIRLDEPLHYVAGQYADVTVPGVIDKARSYSFASAPHKEPQDKVEFFVRHVPGGQFTDWLHSGERLGTRVTVDGPHGSFWLRESSAPILCVAGGSGLAPIKALLEQLSSDGFNREVAFIFGARAQRDLYCQDDIADLISKSGNRLSFVPVLSAEPSGSNWGGFTGLACDFISGVLIDLPKVDAYLCGPPPLVDKSIECLTSAGVSPDHIFYDKFLDASSMPGGR